MRYALLAGFILTACFVPKTDKDGETEDDDGGTVIGDGGSGDGGEPTYEPCEKTWVDWVGDDNPVVGDEWTVWLYCDGALLTGPMVLRFDPLDFALVDDNVVTWTTAGTAIMYVQTGAERNELEVTVAEDE